ncbi:MAG: hypothetical protein HC888_18710, partial [Candidatus Competibacteraceae bacterium]|nr:hypothetical protein [Candidatus Competibacteraceae bacterium]
MYMHPGSEVRLDSTSGEVGNATIAGGAIYADHATLYADGVLGRTPGNGGGIYNDHGVVYGYGIGSALEGGGIYNDHGVVFSPSFIGGGADRGGAIYSSGGFVSMRQGSGYIRSSANGGDIYLANGAIAELSDFLFESNMVTESGAAIYVESGTLRASQCHFSEGSAGDSGGAIFMAGGEATLINCTFAGNVAAVNGAGEGGAIAIAPGAICRLG